MKLSTELKKLLLDQMEEIEADSGPLLDPESVPPDIRDRTLGLCREDLKTGLLRLRTLIETL